MDVDRQRGWHMHVRMAAGPSQLKDVAPLRYNIPGQAAFPFCCWAGLKSVSLPKMKPHTGLHAGWQTVFSLQVFIVLCEEPCEPDTKSDPSGRHHVACELSPCITMQYQDNGGSYWVFASGCGQDRCVYLRPVWLYTWSGSREEQQAPSGSYSCPLSRKHRDMFVWVMTWPSACNQNVRM